MAFEGKMPTEVILYCVLRKNRHDKWIERGREEDKKRERGKGGGLMLMRG